MKNIKITKTIIFYGVLLNKKFNIMFPLLKQSVINKSNCNEMWPALNKRHQINDRNIVFNKNPKFYFMLQSIVYSS